jgi:hypothetical protein
MPTVLSLTESGRRDLNPRPLWHAYRRGWATARKDLPIKDVAAVGGWKDIQTLVNCYQQADDDTMLLVMSHPKKISERVPNG